VKKVIVFVDLFSLLAVSFFFVFVLSIDDKRSYEGLEAKNIADDGIVVWKISLIEDSGSVLDFKSLVDLGFESLSGDKEKAPTFYEYWQGSELFLVAAAENRELKPKIKIDRVLDPAIFDRFLLLKALNLTKGTEISVDIKIGEWKDVEL